MSEILTAVNLLRAGKLVAFPTETVYGLGADARNEAAVRQIFQAKGRPFENPVIVHIADYTQLSDWARDISSDAQRLAQAFWPGPLTLVLKKHASVLDIVTAGQDTVGVRVPNHPIAQALLKAFGGGLAAPSANQFMHLSPTTKEAVREELGDKIELILAGGVCEVGLESTIVDVSGDMPVILRPGIISAQEIEQVLAKPVKTRAHLLQSEIKNRAPGMYHKHYAPLTKTVVLAGDEISAFIATHANSVVVAHHHFYTTSQINLPNNVVLYAQKLYQTLRELDHGGFEYIVIEAVPVEWEAIRDRLSKM